jgi:hypothetical protein
MVVMYKILASGDVNASEVVLPTFDGMTRDEVIVPVPLLMDHKTSENW